MCKGAILSDALLASNRLRTGEARSGAVEMRGEKAKKKTSKSWRLEIGAGVCFE
jgi:hypothetical protein